MIWIVGNNGMLGTELTGALDQAGLPAVGSDREVDITDPVALAAFAAGKGIRWIVNCAAYTAVDRAEDEGELATRLNVQGPENLARLADGLGASLLHISTDYVFSGDVAAPYREDDPVAPTGVYGATKAAGEEKVRHACPRAVILRTAWLYGRHGPNFVATMLRLMAEREKIGVVADQRGSPTWAADLASAIVAILSAPQPRYGTYHYTNGGECSWFDFAVEIQRQGRRLGLLNRDCAVEPLTTAQYPTKAKRPAYSVLSKDKIVADYAVAVPDWRQSLDKYLTGLSASYRRQKKWFSLSDYDLRSVELESENLRFRAALFWCQQSVEKCLKGLIEFYERPNPTHDILKLSHWLKLPLDDRKNRLLKQLVQAYTASRYDFSLDGDIEPVSIAEGQLLVAETKEFLVWAKNSNKLPLK